MPGSAGLFCSHHVRVLAAKKSNVALEAAAARRVRQAAYPRLPYANWNARELLVETLERYVKGSEKSHPINVLPA